MRRSICYSPTNTMKEGKLFDQWNFLKQKIHGRENWPHVSPREIWWCSIGINIGFEIDGKNEGCERPVLVLKIISPNTFVGLPITSKVRAAHFGYVFILEQKSYQVLFGQIRVFDLRRVSRRRFCLDRWLFNDIKKSFHKWL